MKTIAGCMAISLVMWWATPKRATEVPKTEEQITIQNYSFSPQTVTVKTGTRVTRINKDDVQHTVTSSTGHELSSEPLDTNVGYSHTFNAPGTYEYYCSIHSYMKGEVIVE